MACLGRQESSLNCYFNTGCPVRCRRRRRPGHVGRGPPSCIVGEEEKILIRGAYGKVPRPTSNVEEGSQGEEGGRGGDGGRGEPSTMAVGPAAVPDSVGGFLSSQASLDEISSNVLSFQRARGGERGLLLLASFLVHLRCLAAYFCTTLPYTVLVSPIGDKSPKGSLAILVTWFRTCGMPFRDAEPPECRRA